MGRRKGNDAVYGMVPPQLHVDNRTEQRPPDERRGLDEDLVNRHAPNPGKVGQLEEGVAERTGRWDIEEIRDLLARQSTEQVARHAGEKDLVFDALEEHFHQRATFGGGAKLALGDAIREPSRFRELRGKKRLFDAEEIADHP